MNNLVHNSIWEPGPDGGPKYFTLRGSTYDRLCINGFRTCSVTRLSTCREAAMNRYDLAIDVRGEEVLNFGYVIRAVEVQSVCFIVDFFDDCSCLIRREEQQMADRIDYQFNRVTACFLIPGRAKAARVCMELCKTVTACTFYAPSVFLCS